MTCTFSCGKNVTVPLSCINICQKIRRTIIIGLYYVNKNRMKHVKCTQNEGVTEFSEIKFSETKFSETKFNSETKFH